MRTFLEILLAGVTVIACWRWLNRRRALHRADQHYERLSAAYQRIGQENTDAKEQVRTLRTTVDRYSRDIEAKDATIDALTADLEQRQADKARVALGNAKKPEKKTD